jgi:CO/xanthine dehydrogenase FAD-binding subunit
MLYNVREYHRPTDLDEAIRLLRRSAVRTVPLAGGTALLGRPNPGIDAVVDLDGLGLDSVGHEEGALRLGAMVRLQTIVDELAGECGGLLAASARREVPWNLRNAATLGGLLASGVSNSPLVVTLAALAARVTLYGAEAETVELPDLVTRVRGAGLSGQIVAGLSIDLHDPIGWGYEQTGRTPADSPIVCAASVAYPADEGHLTTQTAIGGLLKGLVLAEETVAVEGRESAQETLRDGLATAHAQGPAYADFRGSAEYRLDVALTLARRALDAALDAVAAQ